MDGLFGLVQRGHLTTRCNRQLNVSRLLLAQEPRDFQLRLIMSVRWLPAAVLLSAFSSPSCIPVRGEDTFQPCTGLQFFSMFTELSEALEVDGDMNTRG